mmetsp:Transcript_6197/g.14593  ORF Transcript_6197/g.14593 Transcript_6197/m.14593 type:complete len:526 (+) Transcript_6197:699-2276(+)
MRLRHGRSLRAPDALRRNRRDRQHQDQALPGGRRRPVGDSLRGGNPRGIREPAPGKRGQRAAQKGADRDFFGGHRRPVGGGLRTRLGDRHRQGRDAVAGPGRPRGDPIDPFRAVRRRSGQKHPDPVRWFRHPRFDRGADGDARRRRGTGGRGVPGSRQLFEDRGRCGFRGRVFRGTTPGFRGGAAAAVPSQGTDGARGGLLQERPGRIPHLVREGPGLVLDLGTGRRSLDVEPGRCSLPAVIRDHDRLHRPKGPRWQQRQRRKPAGSGRERLSGNQNGEPGRRPWCHGRLFVVRQDLLRPPGANRNDPSQRRPRRPGGTPRDRDVQQLPPGGCLRGTKQLRSLPALPGNKIRRIALPRHLQVPRLELHLLLPRRPDHVLLRHADPEGLFLRLSRERRRVLLEPEAALDDATEPGRWTGRGPGRRRGRFVDGPERCGHGRSGPSLQAGGRRLRRPPPRQVADLVHLWWAGPRRALHNDPRTGRRRIVPGKDALWGARPARTGIRWWVFGGGFGVGPAATIAAVGNG